MTWRIEYLQSVRKAVQKIPPPDRRRIRQYLEQRVTALEDPRQLGQPLKGALAGLWRYRVGEYRVICEIREEVLVVLVVRVAHRKAVYR